MSATAIILVTISAALHAGWNLIAKSRSPSPSFFLMASLSGALLLSPFVILGRADLAERLTLRAGLLVTGTGFFMALYYASLAGAYRAGHMSVAYPLARSSPIFVVVVVTGLLGGGEQVSGVCVAGILLVVAGCFLVPMRQLGEFRLGKYLNATCGLALLAAVGTAGYSIIDDEALRLLRHGQEEPAGIVRVTLAYIGIETLSAAVWLALFVAARAEGRAALRQDLRTNVRHALAAGAAIYLTYTLVLVAQAFSRNVSYVVAFRQVSIPLGAVLGIFILHEPACLPKILGVGVMLLGLVLVAVG